MNRFFLLLFAIGLIACDNGEFTTHKPHAVSDLFNGADERCEAFFKSESLQALLNKHKKLSALEVPVWDSYRPEKEVVVVTSLSQHADCALLVQGEAQIEIVMNGMITIENGIYDFYFTPSRESSTNFPGELKNVLKERSIKSALIIDLSSSRIDPNSPDSIRSGMNEFLFNTMIHESFHLNVQFSKLGSGAYQWPSWDIQPDREMLNSLCYTQNEKVKQVFSQETAVLRKAVEAQLVQGDRDAAIKFAKDYIERRESRYELLVETRVPSESNPAGVSCAEAESIMELEEGMADYVGARTTYEIGLINADQLAAYLGRSDLNPWFYQSGLGQMLIIRELDPAEAHKIISLVTTSTTWENGVYGAFKRYLGSM